MSLIFFATKDPGFFEMVEYFFHKSCVLAEDKLIDVDMKNMRASREEKQKKAHGILKIIEPCAHVLEVNFPLQRDDGSYEMINGYRAQHSHHRYTLNPHDRNVTEYLSVIILRSGKCHEIHMIQYSGAKNFKGSRVIFEKLRFNVI